ncbi:helix-turn-helix domain-containing protein [Paenibacillus glufosinatiresistens]|uniref:helix-turn-helix domain-containing protein n=1 Tax=Paenibacillus glufosinatiresistens TaxID=3070657 RepID=UPI00286E81C9|nr:helix-turn-helix transcriptional regulator [Paenibacillus sp. YX.27]
MNEFIYYKIIGERIKRKREERCMTQEDLAALVHISRPSITNIEAGRHLIRIHYLYQIAESLDVSVHDLIP